MKRESGFNLMGKYIPKPCNVSPSARLNNLIRGWLEDFEVHSIPMGGVNLTAYMTSIQAIPISAYGTPKDLDKVFSKFDKKIRKYMKGYDVLAADLMPELIFVNSNNNVLHMRAYRHRYDEPGMDERWSYDVRWGRPELCNDFHHYFMSRQKTCVTCKVVH